MLCENLNLSAYFRENFTILGSRMELFITRYIQLKNHRVTINGTVQYVAEEHSVIKFLRSSIVAPTWTTPNFQDGQPLQARFFKRRDLAPGYRYSPEISWRRARDHPGNASSSLESDEKHQEFIRDRKKYSPSPSVFVYTLPNIMAGEIAIRHKIKGENTVFIFERFDPGFIFHYISELFGTNGSTVVFPAGLTAIGSLWILSFHR